MKINNPQSRKKLLLLGAVSLLVLAGAGVLGGFLAGALAASRENQPSTSLETMQNLSIDTTRSQRNSNGNNIDNAHTPYVNPLVIPNTNGGTSQPPDNLPPQ